MLSLYRRLLRKPSPRSRVAPPRRTRLALVPLEDRAVPTVIGPGEGWNDGYVAPDGTVVPLTVSVTNTGGGWLDVSGGNGVAFAAPAPPPPGVTASPYHSLFVSGSLGGWTGESEYLNVLAIGDVCDITISGDLTVGSWGSVGHLSGHDVRVGVWGSVGNVTATGDIPRLDVGGAIGNVTAGGDVGFISTPASVGTVSAGGWVGGVSAGLDVGGVTAGTWVGGSYLEGGGDYMAWAYAPNYGGVQAGRDILGPVTAGKSVANVTAGRDVKGAVTATAGDVWVVQAGGGGTWDPLADPEDPDGFLPYAPGRILGAVTAGRDVHFVSAFVDVTGAVTAQAGWVGWVLSDGTVAGAVTAGTDVGRGTDRGYDGEWLSRWMWGGVYGPWFNLVPGVRAGVDVTGAVTAQAGAVELVRAGRDVAGAVTATAGDVVEVTAGRDVLKEVTAGVDVGRVTAGQDVAGTVKADRDITRVTAERDILEKIEAGRDVVEVTATGDVVGAVAAGRNIGAVYVGGDLVGGLTADDSIGYVSVGWDDGGAVIGAITACVDIGDISVCGLGGSEAAAGNSPNPERPLGTSVYALDGMMLILGPDGMTVYGNLGPTRPAAPALPTGGDIRGAVTAGGNVGTVTAYGAITAAITAGGLIGAGETGGGVWAVGKIAEPVTAGAGALLVRSWDRVEKAVEAPGDVTVWSYGTLVGDVTSRDGAVTAGSWHDVTGAVAAKTDADVRAFGTVGGVSGKTVRSDTGQVRVWAGEKAEAAASAETEVGIYGRKGAGDSVLVESRAGSAFVETGAGGNIAGISLSGDGRYRVEAKLNVSLKSGGSIGATAAKAKDGWLTADAAEHAVLEGTAKTNVWVSGRGGVVDGRYEAQTGWAYAWAFTDLMGTVTAKETLEATARNDINAELTSTDDGTRVTAGRDILKDVFGGYWVEATAARNVDGRVTAGDDAKWASAEVTAGGDVSKKVTSSGYLTVHANGAVTGGAEAKDGWLEATAVGNISGTYQAFDEVVLHAGGTVSSTITSDWEVSVRAGGDAQGSVTAKGAVYVQVGGVMSQAVTAKEDVRVEAVAGVAGAAIKSTDGDVWVVSNGSLSGTAEGKYVADARTTNPAADHTMTVKITGALAAAGQQGNSPWERRDREIVARLAELTAAGQGNSDEANQLRAEQELLALNSAGLT